MFNKEIKGLFEYGNAAYLINSKVYKSNLIKDNNDQVIGILFRQVN